MKELTNEQYADIGKKFVNAMQETFEQLGGETIQGQIELTSDDPHPLLTKLREWEGLHEKNDRDTLMGYFREAGFEFDPALFPWCGAGLRAGLVLASYPDPGEQCYKASNYQFYGERVDDDPQVGDIWISNTHVAVIVEIREDGVFMIIGCNQSNKVCVHPTENRDGKKNYGDVIAIVRPTKSQPEFPENPIRFG